MASKVFVGTVSESTVNNIVKSSCGSIAIVPSTSTIVSSLLVVVIDCCNFTCESPPVTCLEYNASNLVQLIFVPYCD